MELPLRQAQGRLYDAAGNLLTQTDARGRTTTFSYDALNRLTGKSYGAGCPSTVRVGYTYDVGSNGKGRRTGMADGTGVTSWSYDARGRLIGELRYITGTGTFLTQWGYDAADRLTLGFTGNNACTQYDETRGSGVYTGTFAYADAQGGRHGNPSASSGQALTQKGASALTYNVASPASGCTAGTPASKPHAAASAGSNLYRYDCTPPPLHCGGLRGNVISRTVNSATTLFTYDAENRLVAVSGASTATYAHDGDGQRVKLTTGGTTTIYPSTGSELAPSLHSGQALNAVKEQASATTSIGG